MEKAAHEMLTPVQADPIKLVFLRFLFFAAKRDHFIIN